MTDKPVDKPIDASTAWWEKNLDDIDREVVRMSAICQVRILDPGVIDRVLQNDATVCGSQNPAGFAKLRQALMMHYQIRDKAVGVLGEAKTAALVGSIVERLRGKFGERLGNPTV